MESKSNRGRLKNYEKARIIELYVSGMSMKEIANIFDLSIATIAVTTNLYFKKPKNNKTLKSKV